MQIYYINLDARPDRRAFMEEQFARLGLAATRIRAIGPVDVSNDDLERYCNPSRGGTLSPSALYCRLAHLRAARTLLESDKEHAAVFEDDAVLSSRLASFLTAFAASDEKPDLLRLETHLEGLRFREAGVTVAGVSLVKPYSWEPGAAGYIMSRRAADAFVSNPQMRLRNDYTLFNPYGWLGRHINARQAVPALCIQSHHLATQQTPDFGSDNRVPQAARFPLSRWQKLRRELRLFYERDIVVGSRKVLFGLAGVRKHPIAFAPE